MTEGLIFFKKKKVYFLILTDPNTYRNISEQNTIKFLRPSLIPYPL